MAESEYGKYLPQEPWPGVIALCSWARHFNLTMPLSTQVYVYKWLPAILRWLATVSGNFQELILMGHYNNS